MTIELTAAANSPRHAGTLASEYRRFGAHGRYAVAAVHTRFDAVTYFLWDAEATDDQGRATVIRQEPTLEAAVAGLEVEPPAKRRYRCTDGECEYPDELTADGRMINGKFVCDGCDELGREIAKDNAYARAQLADAEQRY